MRHPRLTTPGRPDGGLIPLYQHIFGYCVPAAGPVDVIPCVSVLNFGRDLGMRAYVLDLLDDPSCVSTDRSLWSCADRICTSRAGSTMNFSRVSGDTSLCLALQLVCTEDLDAHAARSIAEIGKTPFSKSMHVSLQCVNVFRVSDSTCEVGWH